MSVAVVHVDYSIPVLWVQYIAVYKKELEAPSSSNKKMQLEGAVQNWEGRMKRNRKELEKIERALYREKEALQGLSPGKCTPVCLPLK